MRVVLRLLTALACLILAPATAGEFIRTEAWGHTEVDARHNAFIKAIEHEIGVLMLSDREARNYNRIKNDIYAYSDGFVAEYKTLSVTPEGAGVHIVVDSKITSSKIKNRILIANYAGPIDSERAVAGYDTYIHSKNQEDALLHKVLQNYPTNAYVTELIESNIMAGPERELVLDIEFSITLNPDFVENLKETLTVIENPNITEYSSKVIINNTGILPIFNNSDTFYLGGTITQNVLHKYLIPSNIRVKIQLESDDDILYSTCRQALTFIKYERAKLKIFAGQVEHYTTKLSDPVLSKIMDKIIKIKLSVVNKQECKND